MIVMKPSRLVGSQLFVGQNLLDPHHWESAGFEGIYLSQARGNGYIKLTWQF